jgi:hypothetical protein
MTSEMATTSWVMLVSLGAFHGVNPAMGWLFAVAIGMQERRRGAVLRAVVPLGAGHALAVAGAVGLALAIGVVAPIQSLRWVVACILVVLGVLRLFRHQHPRWVGMRVGMGGLTVWSFLMATAHGAGLMVVPVFMGMSMNAAGHVHHAPLTTSTNVAAALFATGLHAVSYLAVTVFIAVVVFEKVGVGILRRAWLNLDLIWAGALVVTGAVALML